MTRAPSAYICLTCGVTTSEKGHLCNPVKLERRTACRSPHKLKKNPDPLCERIAKKVKYVCASCGRKSVAPDFLCYPQRITKADKPARSPAHRP